MLELISCAAQIEKTWLSKHVLGAYHRN